MKKNHEMKIQEPLERIVHVRFAERRDLAATFLRFQEHYESPMFKGKVFNLEEFRKWYVNNSSSNSSSGDSNSSNGKKTRKFSYYEDWDGFNVPSRIFEPFYQGEFNPLSRKEKKLLDALEEWREEEKQFYVIGTSGQSDMSTLRHEIAHGLFYTRPEYQKEVLNILKKIPVEERRALEKFLERESGGYHPDVFEDEMQAYIIENLYYLKKKGINTKNLQPVARELKSKFKEYGEGAF